MLAQRAAADQRVVVVASSDTRIQEVKPESGYLRQVVISSSAVRTETTNLILKHSSPQAGVASAKGLPPELQQLLGSNRLSAPQGANDFAVTLASNLAPVIENSLREHVPQLRVWNRLRLSTGLDALAYLGIMGLAHAAVFHRRYRERGQQAILLSAQLNQARLRALQAQLQPHFLFNALNGIATLVRRDPAAAHEMLVSLSELLRLALNQSNRQEIPLREEMEFLDRYVEIQQMRFGDRLRVERTVEPAALECLVPALLLQPLVENAIRHGIEPSPNAGLVRIRAERVDGQVLLAVEDDGAGLPAGTADGSAALKPGLGLSSVRERLESLYPGQFQFHLQPRPEGGVSVEIRLPFHLPAATEAAPHPDRP